MTHLVEGMPAWLPFVFFAAELAAIIIVGLAWELYHAAWDWVMQEEVTHINVQLRGQTPAPGSDPEVQL